MAEEFSERIRRLMQQRGLSMSDLARMMHTQPSTLSRWFSGALPRRNTIDALSKALGVSGEWLVSGEGSMAPRPKDSDLNKQLLEQLAAAAGPEKLKDFAVAALNAASSEGRLPRPDELAFVSYLIKTADLMDTQPSNVSNQNKKP